MDVRQKKFGQKFIDIRPITRYNGSNLIEILINHYYRYLYYADCYWSHILCKEKEWFRRKNNDDFIGVIKRAKTTKNS